MQGFIASVAPYQRDQYCDAEEESDPRDPSIHVNENSRKFRFALLVDLTEEAARY
jgi:hypothetical protein